MKESLRREGVLHWQGLCATRCVEATACGGFRLLRTTALLLLLLLTVMLLNGGTPSGTSNWAGNDATRPGLLLLLRRPLQVSPNASSQRGQGPACRICGVMRMAHPMIEPRHDDDHGLMMRRWSFVEAQQRGHGAAPRVPPQVGADVCTGEEAAAAAAAASLPRGCNLSRVQTD